MKGFWRSYRRVIYWLAGELVGVLLLVLFVVALATMPPIQVKRAQSAVGGYSFSVDTDRWQESVQTYWKTVRTGSLGKTAKQRDVGPLVADRFSNSIKLVALAALIAVGVGAWKGLADFRAMQRRRGAISPMLTSAVQGLPDFWLIMMLQWLAAWLFSHYGWRPFRVIYADAEPVRSLFIPLVCLSVTPASFVARITCTALANVFSHDYIRTARAKGLSEMQVVLRHAMRAASLQILDGLPSVMAIMVANLLMVEYLFNYPGLTVLLKDAIPAPAVLAQPGATPVDVPVLAAAGFCLGLTFSLLHLVINLLRKVADPRLRERDVV